MAGFSDAVENKTLELIVGKTAFTTPTAYVALFTATPSDAGGGTECTGGSYARKITAGSDWTTASAGSISNAAVITFVTPTGSWGTATHFAIMSSLSGTTGADYAAWAALTTPQAIGSGNLVTFAIGALVITLD
jgi:hypothetical protein